jgi:hypothetical protein
VDNSNDDQKPPQSAGGIARREALSPAERREIAKKAATARWQARTNLPVAVCGSPDRPLRIGGSELQCYVLEDGTRVLSQAGFLEALGRHRKANVRPEEQVPPILQGKAINPFISQEILEKSRPIRFQTPAGARASGYRADLLPDVCEVYLRARDAGVLPKNQEHVAKQAEILMRALAHVGIIALVDEVTGYQEIRPQDALTRYLEMIIRKELAAWVKRFPDEFYENIYKLKGWPWPGMKKNRYSVVAHYTRDLVYQRIAPGVLKELETKSPQNDKGHRPNKLHQWLTDDVGHPMLAQHLHSLIMFQRLAIAQGYGWQRFVKMVDQVLPKKGQNLELPLDI